MRRVSLFIVYAAICLVVLSCVEANNGKTKNSKGKIFDKTIKVKGHEKDWSRKYIVFDKNTPDVFYCLPNKPTGEDKIIVRARPIHKLCEYEGILPEDEIESDCYMDVDESQYACKEKYRIMMRLYPPGSEAPYNGAKLLKFMQKNDDNTNKLTTTNDNTTE